VPNTLSFTSEGVWDHYSELPYCDGQVEERCPYHARLRQGLNDLGLTGPLEEALSLLEEGLQQHRQLAELGLSLHWEVDSAGLLVSPRSFLELDWRRAPALLDAELGALTAHRPSIREEWEQLPCLPFSLQLRAEKIGAQALPEGPILLLGDDDFNSLALRRAGFKQEMVVVDIDPRVLAALEGMNLGVDLRQADLREGLPDALRGKFACVITDPPYAFEGISVFLEAARQSLMPAGLLFLSTQPRLLSQPERFPELLEGFALEQSWAGLNRYPFPPPFAQEIGERLSIYGFPPDLSRAILCPPFMYADFYAWRRSKV
jgi:hypothetical protein